jgi:Cu/Ag efflux pump CusA
MSNRSAHLIVTSPNGAQVNLDSIARIRWWMGPAQISRELAKRRIVVGVNVKDRDLGGFVAELQQKVGEKVKLPEGYYLEWGGQFQNMERALGHLAIIVPITIGAIFFLLFLLFGSLRMASLIIMVLPFASLGGVIGLFVTGEYLSVPASVGFIALWGIAVLNGVVLVSYIRSLRQEGLQCRGCGGAGCHPALPSGDDDRDRGAAGADSLPLRHRPGLGSAAPAGHRGDRRPYHLHPADAGDAAHPVQVV